MSVIERLVKDQWLRQQKFISERKEGVVFITDLTLCPLRREFSKEFPIIYTVEPPTIVGTLCHWGLEEFLDKLLVGQREVELARIIDGVTVQGTIDFMTKDTVFEIKSGRDHIGQEPAEHHVLQVRLYMWLAKKPKGKIIYVTFGRLAEYDVTNPCTDDEVRMLLQDDTAPKWDWECKSYCLYSRICPRRKA